MRWWRRWQQRSTCRHLRSDLPLWPFLAAAGLLETTLRPLGIQPPLHRRRMDFFRKSFRLDGQKARTMLGFNTAVAFAEGARRTAAWYQDAGML